MISADALNDCPRHIAGEHHFDLSAGRSCTRCGYDPSYSLKTEDNALEDFIPLDVPVPALTIKQEAQPAILTITKQGPLVEVIRIDATGRLFWYEREVTTDEAFRGAMLELARRLVPPDASIPPAFSYTCPECKQPGLRSFYTFKDQCTACANREQAFKG